MCSRILTEQKSPSSPHSSIARTDLPNSIDTLHLIHRITRRPPDQDLIKRGFKAIDSKFGIKWVFNRDKTEDHSYANITLYKLYGVGYGCRVNISVPKFARGQNVDLPDDAEIHSTLLSLSAEISDISGVYFDSFSALTARVDYSTNLQLKGDAADPFFRRLHRLRVPRMPYQADRSRPRSVYHGNRSRMLKSYDKTLEHGVRAADEITVRMEYMFASEESVSRFAKRLLLPDYRARTILSSDVRRAAVDQIYALLQLASFDANADYSIGHFFDRTGDIELSRRCSSFVAAYDAFGPDFYQRPDIHMSPHKYSRDLKECENHGF